MPRGENEPMPLIAKEESALRLARAIANDVKLYNHDRLTRADEPWTELADEIAEGRRLYESRVAPELHGLLDAVLVEVMPQLGSGRRPGGSAVPDPGDPPSSIPQGFFSDAPTEAERTGAGGSIVLALRLAA